MPERIVKRKRSHQICLVPTLDKMVKTEPINLLDGLMEYGR